MSSRSRSAKPQAVLYRRADEILTLAGAARKGGRRVSDGDLSILEKGSFLVVDGRIAWIGRDGKVPKDLAKKKPREVSLKGRTVLPGFVECHTHSVFAGHRADEFESRNRGVTYQEIAAKGGGILSTMKKTRAASTPALAAITQTRADVFASQGVTTLEIKSGYALNLKDELRMLEAAGRVKGPRVVRTFLGAHSKPPEFETYEAYLEFLAADVLPLVKKKKLASRVDVWIEKGFFPLEASKRYLEKAKALGFDVVIHADQLTLSGGSVAAVELGARSADHVIQIGKAEIAAFASSDTVAVLLPSADLYMKCAYPPARELIDQGARVALATDFNPGTSPSQDLSLVGLLARLEMKMTLPEVLSAYTVGAATALGLSADIGSLEAGKSADFLCISDDWQMLFYGIGDRFVRETYLSGHKIFTKQN